MPVLEMATLTKRIPEKQTSAQAVKSTRHHFRWRSHGQSTASYLLRPLIKLIPSLDGERYCIKDCKCLSPQQKGVSWAKDHEVLSCQVLCFLRDPFHEGIDLWPVHGIRLRQHIGGKPRRPGLVQDLYQTPCNDFCLRVFDRHQRYPLTGFGCAYQQKVIFKRGPALGARVCGNPMRREPQRPIRALTVMQQRVVQAIFRCLKHGAGGK